MTETKGTWGGRRHAKTYDELVAAGTLRPDRHAELIRGAEGLLLPADALALALETVGLPPRRRLLAGESVTERTDGGWLADFCREFCRQSIGRFSGQPLELYPEQRAFLDDALAFDDDGRRLYSMAAWFIPRKNGKSTTVAGVQLALGSPLEGEGKPLGIIAAGSREQAGPLFEQARDFALGHPVLRSLFDPLKLAITCSMNGGAIRRVAGDGKLNHGLNPYSVAIDELWSWLTPKQVENFNALTTADGARDDALTLAITTAGWDAYSILGQLWKQARESEFCEARAEMGGGGFVTRDPDARLLVHCYAIAEDAPLDDIAEWKRANPAPWRTEERIAQDLGRLTLDESAKRRLYGNGWTSARSVWIPADRVRGATDAEVVEATLVEDGTKRVSVAVDASLNHDTTAVAWAAPTDDGRIAVRARVFSTRTEVPHHELHDGGRIRLAVVESFIAGSALELDEHELRDDELAQAFVLEAVGYDPRYFNRSAESLSEAGLDMVVYEPFSQPMRQAIQDFYSDMLDGRIVLDGDPVIAAHLNATAGTRTERGWKIEKLKAAAPIDAVPAIVMAVALARSLALAPAVPFGGSW